jgi:hypothetical protein
MRSRSPRSSATKPRAEARAVTAREFAGVTVGRLIPGSTPAGPRVDFEGNPAGPVTARSTVALDDAIIERAVKSRQGVVLQFEGGDPARPIIVGLVQEPKTLLSELLAGPVREAKPGKAEKAAKTEVTAKSKSEARLDGKKVVLEADHQIELRCGDASITLTRDGKIIVKGAYVETYSRGVNRIKGGAVKIN